MNKAIISILATTLFTLFSGIALAHGGGGGGGGGHAGGMSSNHMSTQGMDNTNGPDAVDRDKGPERAEDRESAQGAAHKKSHSASTKQTDTHDKGHHGESDTGSN